MAKKKTKKRRSPQPVETSSGGGLHAARETIESIVIAFVLAFLFRTFEAEAFVIPTGSMSPALQGQHKDVSCSECGYRFRTTASTEGEARNAMIARLRNPRLRQSERRGLQHDISAVEVIAGLCPMCRQPVVFRDDNLPTGAPPSFNLQGIEKETSYPGDRILVNKYSYTNHDPERWDVVVFKFPGNGEMNYIKRLVGLPDETLRVFQGDIFIRSNEPDAEFQIERKPAGKVRAMLQEVHDTHHAPAILYDAGWPLRWTASSDRWQIDAATDGKVVKQHFQFDTDADAGTTAWLRYRHYVPSEYDWGIARRFGESGRHKGITREQWVSESRPELVSDFNAYNAQILRGQLMQGHWQFEPSQLGVQWVSDLAVECTVDIQQAQGELILDIVEAGKHFRCRIDLKTGQATLGIDGDNQFGPTAQTSLSVPDEYELLFANVDDQLLLWIDGELIEFDGATTFDADQLFGNRRDMVPVTSEQDAGDLAPVGVGARGAKLTVNRLKVLRDIYYVAARWDDRGIAGQFGHGGYYTDYYRYDASQQSDDGPPLPKLRSPRQIFRDPETWPRFATRRHRDFPIAEDQFFVMGDNSPASQDCRLWKSSGGTKGTPGGAYLDRRLLTGKAVCVFWPHSWGGIPGVPILPGFPGFGDMRIVR